MPKREYLIPSVPNIPVSRSVAAMVVTTVPGLAVSDTRAVYASCSNFGGLSLVSVTETTTVAVDDKRGLVSVSSAIT